MTSVADDSTGAPRWAGGLLVAYGLAWLAVGGTIALVVRFGVPTPAELLTDVAGRPWTWIGANALLVVQQLALVAALPALVAGVGTASSLPAATTRGAFAIAAGAFVASGVVHGVLGAHLAAKVGDGPLGADVVDLAELVHALGDTCWFVGVGATIAATAAATAGWWRSGGAPRHVTVLGAAAVVVNLGQFGWFADHAFGVLAGPGAMLQAAWFAAVGRRLALGPDAAPTAPRWAVPPAHR